MCNNNNLIIINKSKTITITKSIQLKVELLNFFLTLNYSTFLINLIYNKIKNLIRKKIISLTSIKLLIANHVQVSQVPLYLQHVLH